MNPRPNADAVALRRTAEARHREKAADGAPSNEADLRRLQHELEVHQIELEMQNDELRAARAEIEAGLERFTDLFDFAPIGYFNLAADGTIRLANLAGATQVGIARALLPGRRFSGLVSAGDRPVFALLFSQVFTTREKQSCEIALLREGGAPLAVQLEATASADGTECRAAVIDVSARKAAELSLQQSEEQLRRSQRVEAVGTLAGGIAHDLNNILLPMVIGSKMLLEHCVNPKDREMLTVIQSSADRGSAIVRQLLTFSRGIVGERISVSLPHLLDEMVTFVRATFPGQIALESRQEPDLASVLGDPTQLHQVLLNLCINSRDAMPHGGTLTLSAENVRVTGRLAAQTPGAKPGPHVRLDVIDTGTGIPAEILPKIFDPFFTTKEIGQGTGLGLSTTLGIVKSHGGFLTVETEVDQGTTFSVYLPSVPAEKPATAGPVAPELPTAGHGELVLVVDDEKSIREIVAFALRHQGYRVLTAVDGVDALAQFTAHRTEVKLVFTDLDMPRMDGLALTRELRRMNPALDVIVTSGLLSRTAPGNREAELKALGVRDILPKPFSIGNLLHAVAAVLRGDPTTGA